MRLKIQSQVTRRHNPWHHRSHEVCQGLTHCEYKSANGFWQSIARGFYESKTTAEQRGGGSYWGCFCVPIHVYKASYIYIIFSGVSWAFLLLDTQMTLALLQEQLLTLRGNDAEGFKGWLSLGLEELGRQVVLELMQDKLLSV